MEEKDEIRYIGAPDIERREMGITIRGCLRVQGREQHADRRTRASGGPGAGAGLRAREVNWIRLYLVIGVSSVDDSRPPS